MWKNRIGHQPADGPITAPSKSFVVNPDLFQIRMIFILFLCIIKHQSVPIFTRSCSHSPSFQFMFGLDGTDGRSGILGTFTCDPGRLKEKKG